MALVTIQLIEGLERGYTYRDVPTPVTIGREDDNSIRLNDERVSRFHAKIQEDGGRLILTDLESTNGTRVNGHPVQMRVVQVGDQVSVGRCLLIIGSNEQIVARADSLARDKRSLTGSSDQTVAAPHGFLGQQASTEDSESGYHVQDLPLVDEPNELFPEGPPVPPSGLSAIQRAQFSDFLAYCHEQIRVVLLTAFEDAGGGGNGPNAFKVDWEAWQRLLKTEMDLASYMKRIADPDG